MATEPDPQDESEDLHHYYQQEAVENGVTTCIERKKEQGRFYYEVVPGREEEPLKNVSLETVGRFCNWKEQGSPTLEEGREVVEQSTEQGVYRFQDDQGKAVFEADPENLTPHFYLLNQDLESDRHDNKEGAYWIALRGGDEKLGRLVRNEQAPTLQKIAPNDWSYHKNGSLEEHSSEKTTESFVKENIKSFLLWSGIMGILYYGPFVLLKIMAHPAFRPCMVGFVGAISGEVFSDEELLNMISMMRGDLNDFWMSIAEDWSFIISICSNPSRWTRLRMLLSR